MPRVKSLPQYRNSLSPGMDHPQASRLGQFKFWTLTILALHMVCIHAIAGDLDAGIELPECGGSPIRAVDRAAIMQVYPGEAYGENYVENLVRDRIGANKAADAGISDTTRTKWDLWNLEMNRGLDRLYSKIIYADIGVTNEEIVEEYEKNIEMFREPERYSFRYIFCETLECKDSSEIAAVRHRMDQAHKELLENLGESQQRPWMVSEDAFNRVAKKYSEVRRDPTRIAGPFTVDKPLQDVIKNTALSLEPGEISPVFATRHGYEIMRLESRIPAATMEYAQISSGIVQNLDARKRQESRKEYVGKLHNDSSRYTIHTDVLEKLLKGEDLNGLKNTYVIEVGDEAWDPGKFLEFTAAVFGPYWALLTRDRSDPRLEMAEEFVWVRIVLPMLLFEDTQKEGFVGTAQEEALYQAKVNRYLTQAWLEKEKEIRIAKMSPLSTSEIQYYYENNKKDFESAARLRVQQVIHPLSIEEGNELGPANVEKRFRKWEPVLLKILDRVQKGESPEEVVSEEAGEDAPIMIKEQFVTNGGRFGPDLWKHSEEIGLDKWVPKTYRDRSGIFIAKILEILPEGPDPWGPEMEEFFKGLMEMDREKKMNEFLKEQLAKEAEECLE